MLGLLALIGGGLLIASLAGGSDEDDDAEPEVMSDDPDLRVDETYRAGLEESYRILVEVEGELDREDADARLAAIGFGSGAVNLETGGGADTVMGGSGDDRIDAGAGDDAVMGGAGDDVIHLGDGDDIYGQDDHMISRPDDFYSFPTVDLALMTGAGQDVLEGGDDQVHGGAGDDEIADGFGANTIHGQQGHDFIVTVDDRADPGNADTVLAGYGNDTVVADEGDQITLAEGFDEVWLELAQVPGQGFEPTRILDFVPEDDEIQISSDVLSFVVGDADFGELTVEDMQDGSGAVIAVNGVPVAEVFGGAGLSVDDLRLG